MRFRVNYGKKVDLFILTAGVLGALVLGLWGNWFSSLSLIIGVLTTIAYLKLIARQVRRLTGSNSTQAKQAAIKGVFFRYLLVMIVLVIGTRIRRINLYWIMAGLLLIPLSSFISLWNIKGHEQQG